MKTTIDAAGRIVIPKKLRDEAGLRPGAELEVRCHEGVIEIEPSEVSFHVEERDGLLVAVADGPMPTLKADLVAETLDALRAERGSVGADAD
jgi:AbrB family looped-hinge helix DNA binding protein